MFSILLAQADFPPRGRARPETGAAGRRGTKPKRSDCAKRPRRKPARPQNTTLKSIGQDYSSSSTMLAFAASMTFCAMPTGTSSYRSNVVVKEPLACVMLRRSVAYLKISACGTSAMTCCMPST